LLMPNLKALPPQENKRIPGHSLVARHCAPLACTQFSSVTVFTYSFWQGVA
jgi:hypothetical protein